MFGNSCQLYIGRVRVERINLQQDSMGSKPQPLAHEVGVKTTRRTHTLSLSLPFSLSLSLSLLEYLIQIAFSLQQWLPELAAILSYTYIARLVLIHFADLNGTDRTPVKNVMIYLCMYIYICIYIYILTYNIGDCYTWFLFIVPVSGQPLYV